MREVILPALTLRPYQEECWDKLWSGVKKSFLLWHRRAGKDLFSLNFLISKAMQRVGNYWYILPQQNQVRRAIWEGITSGEYDSEGNLVSPATRYLDFIPPELIYKKNNSEMKITLINPTDTTKPGSIISFLGGDNYDALAGSGIVGVVVSEYPLQKPNLYDLILEPMLQESNGWVLFNGTPRGENHAEKMYTWLETKPQYYVNKKTIADTGVVSEEKIDEERERGKPEEIIQQEYYCFKPTSLITTSLGQKPISEIKEGDMVLTHSNRMRKVLGTISREYDGEMVVIKSLGNGKDLVCTPNHPIRVYRDGQRYEWVAAENIVKGDKLCFPKRNMGIKTVSEDFAKVISWFISEGSFSKNAVQFTVASKDDKEKDIVVSALEGCGYKANYNKHGSVYQIYVYDTSLCDLLASLCGSGASNKRIPFDVIGGHEETVFDNLILGDGYRRGDFYSYSTVSEKLAYDFQQLAIMVGKKASITKGKGCSVIQGRVVNAKDRYSIQCRDSLKGEKMRNTKYSMIAPVVSVSREYYVGTVHNLHIQFDESYVADGRVVHNCSFAGAIHGAYYADILNRNKDKLGMYPYDPRYQVYTMWDLGVGDSMAIWWVQIVQESVRVIDYYENHTYGFAHYSQIVLDKEYNYASHMIPHDGAHRNLTPTERAMTAQAQLLQLGLNRVEVVPRTKDVLKDIQAVRAILPRCYFNEETTKDGYMALKQYRKEFDENRRTFKLTPLHDWTSHGSDAFRILPYLLDKATASARKRRGKEWDGSF